MSKRQIPQADTVRMPLDMLLPADYNPRRISDRAMKGLRASLERFGELGGIVYNKRTGRLVGGHQRVKALAAMGVKDAEVRVVDLPIAEEKAANLALNHPGIGGEWDDALLAVVLDETRRDLPTAFQELQLDDIIRHASEPAPLDNERAEEAEDYSNQAVVPMWSVLIECRDEAHQSEMIDRFLAEGIKCRAL